MILIQEKGWKMDLTKIRDENIRKKVREEKAFINKLEIERNCHQEMIDFHNNRIKEIERWKWEHDDKITNLVKFLDENDR